MIREARRTDLEALRAIERRAGEPFRELGMEGVADDEPPSNEALLSYVEAGRAWVATGDGDTPLGYLLLQIIEEAGHVEQVSVDPAHAHQGLGKSLIEHAAGWAQEHGLTALTLTTFADVPWNAPYFQRLGFRPLEDHELSAGLREIRRREAARGLDAWPRLCMRREVGPPSR